MRPRTADRGFTLAGPTAAATTTAATGRFTGLAGNCVDLADLAEQRWPLG